jgi:hypothetical protein
MEVRKKAWERMHLLWHPQVAAERLVKICEGLLENVEGPIYKEGPCSLIPSAG